WSENNGDPIEPTSNQQIQAIIVPNFEGFQDNNVTLKYSINDPTLSNPNTIIGIKFGNSYLFSISGSNYDSSDTIYYQIWITNTSHTIYKHTTTVNFVCYDRLAPTISNIQDNATTYYRDVEITCHVKDNDNGSGLKNVTMYIDIGDTAEASDILILSNNSGAIPPMEGDFKFVIDEKYISARSGKELHYRIYAEDNEGNIADSGDLILSSIDDDIKPFINFFKHYAPPEGIENNESLIVSFIATEVNNGSGLQDLSLYVKVANTSSPPTSGNDYNYGPINPDGGINDLSGGTFNFTIPENYYNYGDYIYFFLNATDYSGNKNSTFTLPFPTSCLVRVNDTFAPKVINYSSNGLDAAYNVSKILTFEITEPKGASGINNDSLILYYWIGKFGVRHEINATISKFGGKINFTIDHNLYSYGDTVYYQLNVSDLAGNKYSTGNGTFYVGDPYAPTAQFLRLLNSSIILYQDNFNISFRIWEDVNGSGLTNVELFVKNESESWANEVKIYRQNTTLPAVGGDIRFEINSSCTSARELLDWRLKVTDNAGQFRYIYGSVFIDDKIPPSIYYDKTNNTQNEFEYYQNAAIYYIFSEPIGASGFSNDKAKLRLCYKLGGNSNSPNDYDGFITPSNSSINDYYGRYKFVIPESILDYNDGKIEFWLNGSDLKGNINNTWNDRRTIYIIDSIRPTISLYLAENGQAISYHLDKIISFDALELSDSSGLKNATLYWKINSAVKMYDFDGKISITFTAGQDSAIHFGITLLRTKLQYKYEDTVYYMIDVYDMAGNNGTSASHSFSIIDTVNPAYIEDPDNLGDWTWRVNRIINFTVYDVDYDNSSGIQSVVLYYKAGSNPSISDYDGKVFPDQDIVRELRIYSFNITLNASLYQISEYIYYFIKITDRAGNERDSSISHFRLRNEVYIQSSIIGPKENEWLGNGTVKFYIELYLSTNMYILINDTVYTQENSVNKFENYIVFDKEGTYIVKFLFLNNVSVLTFKFSIDLYPPSKITSFEGRIYGLDVIVLSWDAPNGADDKTTYKIYRSEKENFEIGESTLLAEIKPGESLIYEDSDIKQGKTYYYRIVAIDRVGHQSEASDVIKVKVPVDPLTTYLPLIIVIGAVCVIGVVVYKVSVSKKREKLFSKIDFKELDEKYGLELEEIEEPKGPRWTEIKTKAEIKPTIVQEGAFEFAEESATEILSEKEILENYWETKVGTLIIRAIEYELTNDYGNALRIYTILTRISKKTGNKWLTNMLEGKKAEIFDIINE
ncbi:MAG: hypothetical protein ACTSQS_11685, partial [Promethearchaeota archaeon]